MNTKHTPGPWKELTDRQGYTRSITGVHGPETVNVINWNGISRPATENGKANARLIAAAPELLEALGALMAKLSAKLPALQYHDCKEAYEQARAAIAKATNG
jgi:hypothetical protein